VIVAAMVVIEHVTDRVLDAVCSMADGVPDARRDGVGEQHRGDADGCDQQREASAPTLALGRASVVR
jgi:hypothetical protein